MDGGESRAASWRPAPEHLEGAFAEYREPTRIASRREDLGVQLRGAHDLDAGQVPEESADLRRILHDDEQAPRLPIASASHLPAARAHVAAVLRPLHVGVHAEAVEDLDALLGRTSVRLEGLDPVLDDDGQAEFLLEFMSAGGDDCDFLHG